MNRRVPRPAVARGAAVAALLLAACVAESASDGGSLAGLATPQSGRSMRSTSTMRVGETRRGDGARKLDPKAPPRGDLDESSNFDNFNVPPGATHVLLDEQGPGVITHLWMTFLGPEPQGWAKGGSANHQEMLLRIYWDGEARPSVEAPVGDFFASCFGRRDEVISTPVVVEGADSYNCFWHMPFRKSARIEIENQSDKPISLLYYNVDWIKKERLPDDVPYFHAQYRQEYPVEHGKDYVVLDTQGKGHYVGTVLAVRTRSPEWFGEGDEKICVDGETTPSIWGTGTEDYFLSAWGLKKTSTPCFGVPYFDQWGIVGGHTSAYRWHLNDPIVFNTGIKVTFEHFGWMSVDENADHKHTSWNEREDDYASVAFWYQTGPSTFTARATRARTAEPRPGRRLRPRPRRRLVPRRRRRHGAAARALPRTAAALHAAEGRRRVARDPLRRGRQGAAAPPAERDDQLRLRPLAGLPERREARRRARFLQRDRFGPRVPPARLLARAGPLRGAPRLHRQESGVAGLLLRHRVGAAARTAPARAAIRIRPRPRLADESDALLIGMARAAAAAPRVQRCLRISFRSSRRSAASRSRMRAPVTLATMIRPTSVVTSP
jgi:hypothetical protein